MIEEMTDDDLIAFVQDKRRKSLETFAKRLLNHGFDDEISISGLPQKGGGETGCSV